MTEAEGLKALIGPDDAAAARAEAELWAMWHRSGNPEIDALLREGIQLMERRDLAGAEDVFARMIARAPEFAEGWNKRATVYYLAGEYQRSIDDCDQVLKRNPGHFGALSGLGQIYFRLERYDESLTWFRKALEVNPNMLGVEFNIKGIEQMLQEKRTKT